MLKKTHIKYLLVKLALFVTLAVLVFIFREKGVEHLKPFIGSLMVLYGVDGVAYELVCHGKHFYLANKTYLGFIELMLGIVLIAVPIQFEYVCVIWATWSIIREAHEIKEIVVDMKMILPRILSGAESIAAIVFSILLILEPGEHHALIHMCLLSVELILNPLVLLIDEFLIYIKEKKLEKEAKEQEE